MEEFCRRVSPRLVGSLLLLCGQRQVAEDMAQEALARAWERWSAVSLMESPEGWVFRVAFNLASSHQRRAMAERRATARLADAVAPSDLDSDVAVALRQALIALPDRQRQAVVLRYYAQLSVVETADAMDCAAGTVKALTSQAVAALRRGMGDAITLDSAMEVLPDA